MSKTVIIVLPYYKQGSDLGHFLDQCSSNKEALESHASTLEAAARQLRDIGELIADTEVEFCADTHHISVSGPEDLMDKLVEMDLAEYDQWEEIDEEEESDGD